jgi:hypothetical protein
MAEIWVRMSMQYFLNLNLQQVLGLSAFPSGSKLLPMTTFIMLGMIIVAPKLIATVGPNKTRVGGLRSSRSGWPGCP